ncbi:MAG: phosphopantetheine-binding protein [Bacteroidota bacterium]
MEDFIIEKIQEIAFAKVKSEDPLWTSKVLDSITLVELIVEIETEFNITVPFKDIIEENFETVSRMIAYISSKK